MSIHQHTEGNSCPPPVDHKTDIEARVKAFIANNPDFNGKFNTKINDQSAQFKRALTMDKKKGPRMVYIIANDTTPDWLKVGVSGHLSKRFKEAQTWSPSKVRLVAYGLVDVAYQVEHMTHIRFPSSNEWVKASKDRLIAFIQDITGVELTQGHDLACPS